MTTTDLSEGSARLVLLNGMTLLHPEDAVFEAMLESWTRQQRGGRRLQPKTINDRLRVVRQFNDFAETYPWNWSAAAMDEWTTYLMAELHRGESTIRGYQTAVRLFCDYITSPHYQWPQECELRFGTHPVQICHEWNTAAHLVDYEGQASRPPMTREEIQLFLDYADAQVDRAIRLGRKGSLAAYRDATVYKVIYGGCGARRRRSSTSPTATAIPRPRNWAGSDPSTSGTARGRRVRRRSDGRSSASCPGPWTRLTTMSPTSVPTIGLRPERPCGRPSAADGFRPARSRTASPSTAMLWAWIPTLCRTACGTPRHPPDRGWRGPGVRPASLESSEGVHDVQHEPGVGGDLRGGGGYLPPSITQFSRRFDAGADGC